MENLNIFSESSALDRKLGLSKPDTNISTRNTLPDRWGVSGKPTWGDVYDLLQVKDKKKEINEDLKEKGIYDAMQALMTQYKDWELIWVFIANNDRKLKNTFKLRPCIVYSPPMPKGIPPFNSLGSIAIIPIEGEHDKEEKELLKKKTKAERADEYMELYNPEQYGLHGKLYLNISDLRKVFKLNSHDSKDDPFGNIVATPKFFIAKKVLIDETTRPLNVATLNTSMIDRVQQIMLHPDTAFTSKEYSDLKKKYFV